MPRVKTRSMTRLRFHCGKCGTPVTRPVRRLPAGVALSDGDGDRIARGLFAFDNWQAAFNITQRACYLVNPSDLLGTTWHPDGRRTCGCCGVSGGSFEEPNRVCECGAELGEEFTDCWGPHGIWLRPDLVRASDGSAAPFPVTSVVDPAWAAANGGTGLVLARSIDNGHAFGNLPVLADALEEGGCGDPVVLGHLRSPGKHRGGCWFVDEILGKR